MPDLILRHGVTHLQCTPSLAGMLLLDPRADEALGALRCLLVGGEALPPDLARALKRRLGGELLNMYGPTETTVWSLTHAVGDGDGETIPIGRPIANATAYVVDEAGELVPPGLPGELLIGGPGVARGYLHRPEQTAERFVPDPFTAEAGEASADDPRLYRTGDRVRLRHDGVFEFLGRLDHQVKLRGHRIELGEIEAALRRHAGVRDALAALDPSGPGGGELVAAVTPENGALDADALRAWLGRELPAIMVPTRLDVRDALPRTPNGKLDRRALVRPLSPRASTEMSGAGRDAGRPDAAHDPPAPARPEGEVEAAIAAVWREVLGRDDVDATASFFDLGGHSLLAAQALYLLRARLGRDLAITDLFRFPSVRALARHLARAGDDAEATRSARERADARRDILARRRLARQSSGR